MSWMVYDVREPGEKGFRDPRPFKDYRIPREFKVTLRGYGNSWLILTFRDRKVVSQKTKNIKPLPENEIKELETKILDYLQGKRNIFLRPINERLIGFYIHYYGDDNKFPQRAVLVRDGKIIEVIPETAGNEVFDETIWCGHCIEKGEECEFCITGKGIPKCFADYK